MRIRSILLTALTLALASTACQPPAQEAAGLSEEDVAAIREAMAAVPELALAGDCEAMFNLWTEDGILMPPNAPPVVGRAEMLAMCETWTVMEFSSTPVEIDGRDGLAYTRGEHSWTFTVEGVDEPLGESGKWIMIWRKQPDGSWLVAVDIWNSDLPLPE